MFKRWATASLLCVGLVATVLTAEATAQRSTTNRPSESVTFHRDVEPILQEHCQTCHRPGEIGSMSLLTFEETRPWARAIKSEVEARAMPPWYAAHSSKPFTHVAVSKENGSGPVPSLYACSSRRLPMSNAGRP